jgi:hypothetical protein
MDGEGQGGEKRDKTEAGTAPAIRALGMPSQREFV